MQESHWVMGSGVQFGKEQVGCPALIMSLKQKVWECAPTPLSPSLFFLPLPLPLLYWIFYLFFYCFILFLTRC